MQERNAITSVPINDLAGRRWSPRAFDATQGVTAAQQVAFHLGPDIGLARDSTEANQIFADYYAESLRKLLLGPVIDIGGVGGYLGQLRKAQP